MPSRQLDEAIQQFRRVIDLDPKFAQAHYNLGNALYAKQQRDEAILEFRKAIELDPKQAEAHCNLGLALRDTGELTESLNAYRTGHRLGSQPGWRIPRPNGFVRRNAWSHWIRSFPPS